MPEILVLQEFRDFLYRVLYATSQIQTGQNQNAKRVTGEATPLLCHRDAFLICRSCTHLRPSMASDFSTCGENAVCYQT